jgi:hypothetical protein
LTLSAWAVSAPPSCAPAEPDERERQGRGAHRDRDGDDPQDQAVRAALGADGAPERDDARRDGLSQQQRDGHLQPLARHRPRAAKPDEHERDRREPGQGDLPERNGALEAIKTRAAGH